VAPRLFAVARQEIRESRSEISSDVPDEDCGGIAALRISDGKLTVFELHERRIAEGFVAFELADDRRKNRRGHDDDILETFVFFVADRLRG
jgi:hypothetical protein